MPSALSRFCEKGELVVREPQKAQIQLLGLQIATPQIIARSGKSAICGSWLAFSAEIW
jgi:hypothetical protein